MRENESVRQTHRERERERDKKRVTNNKQTILIICWLVVVVYRQNCNN